MSDVFSPLPKKLSLMEVSGARMRGKQRVDLMDSVKVAFGSRRMAVVATRQYAKNGKEWRALVQMYVNEIDAATLLGSCVIWIVFPLPHGLYTAGCLGVGPLRDEAGSMYRNGSTTEDKA